MLGSVGAFGGGGQLAALPMIGPKRAQQIVEYRQEQQSTNAGQPVFGKLADLTRVKGIGAATTQALEPYLIFPESPSETSDR